MLTQGAQALRAVAHPARKRRPTGDHVQPKSPITRPEIRILLTNLAPTLPGRFRAFFPLFPLSFSARCGRAERQVRKAKPLKISDLEGVDEINRSGVCIPWCHRRWSLRWQSKRNWAMDRRQWIVEEDRQR
ncbi:hypothetical protein RSc0893.5 [Ralstonia pseudosolanacearum GMI1000]|uniref:Uncharacterized protein n=1 Tax=Ralstonia nicotianae (strain ATCC BAA-1114 / GMI1000) TaxID=267608 RepID=Q1MTJ9_RALN1|nr:hypothetical protein RSc0893.5 [Ralstonia pseudosolanacearum GMI1000]